MGIDDEIRSAKLAKRREAADRKAWSKSAVGASDQVVGRPEPPLDAIVAELLPRIPRKQWSKTFVGSGPDGVTRIVSYPGNLSFWQRRSCTAVRLFQAKDPVGKDQTAEWGIALLADGRVGDVFGEPKVLRSALIRLIA